jgi:putative ATP-binding cassette transporter
VSDRLQLTEGSQRPEGSQRRSRPRTPSLFLLLPQFLLDESDLLNSKLFVVTAVGGLATGALVSLVLLAIRDVSSGASTLRTTVLFALCLLLSMAAKQRSLSETGAATEAILRKVRLRVVDKIRKAELRDFEQIGPSRYYTVLTGELQTIVETSKVLVGAASSAVIVAGALIYIGVLSLPAAMTATVTIALGATHFIRTTSQVQQLLVQTAAAENTFYDRMRDVRDGFKELKINADKSDDLFDNYVVRSALAAERLKVAAGDVFNRNQVFGQSFFYILLGVVVLVLPVFQEVEAKTLSKVVAALIFAIGPLSEVVGAILANVRAGAAIMNLHLLEDDLERIQNVPRQPRHAAEVFGPFEELRLEGVTYVHHEPGAPRPFSLKPINLTVRKGDVVFLVGGNGSGKSTLVSVLLGLNVPNSGEILVNGAPVSDGALTAYRSLFAMVLQDYHLFDRLYGSADPGTVRDLLEELGLSGKTDILEDGSFTTIDLSGGQRKRIAMAIARADDPDVFVFDEWAADQEPFYKKRFYEETLPMLSKMGKTVIAVSHDDRYFPSDHRNVYRMEDGALFPYTGASPTGAALDLPGAT